MKSNLKLLIICVFAINICHAQNNSRKEKALVTEPNTKISIEWADIPTGTFLMGSPKSEADRMENEEQHEVSLDGFKMSKYEITFEQYDAFCEATGRRKPYDHLEWGRGKRPVINVSWDDAVAFTQWLGEGCRLPTEAEWEYACRAGTTTAFNMGSNLTTEKANFNGNNSNGNNSESNYREQTLPVGSFSPNEWGLYDMHGNVAEWCLDLFDSNYFRKKYLRNPQGPIYEFAPGRVIRGGSWSSDKKKCRSANRENLSPSLFFNNSNGFRVVFSKTPDTKIPIEWADIPIGTYWMGSSGNEVGRDYDELSHLVYIDGFYMSKYPITFEQYDAFCEATNRNKPNDSGFGRGKRSVVNVTWDDAVAFTQWLGGGSRLPLEAEWEYACRAGTGTRFNTGDSLNISHAYFNGYYPHNNNAENICQEQNLPIDSIPPNVWGLHYMHGNVWEWCLDWYHDDYYSFTWHFENTQGPASGTKRVIRGGSWLSNESSCRSANRDNFSPSEHKSIIGFRIVVPKSPNAYTDLEWVDIPSGTFKMGSPNSEEGRVLAYGELLHEVSLNGFKMSKYEITFEQYDVFCDATNRSKPKDNGWGRGKRPVINVSWDDAVAFTKWLGRGCRLPTEAEWEYACRAGTETPFSTGENLTTSQANYNGQYPYNNNPRGEYLGKTLPVGSFPPNAWGLYDMHGNVSELCLDWLDNTYYSRSPWQNPQGPASGTTRVNRGGNWQGYGVICRSAARGGQKPEVRHTSIGFRVVLPE